MAIHLLLLLSYALAIVAASTLQQPYSSQQYNPSMHPQPQEFPTVNLYQAYMVIQRFKKSITCDPRNITSTWVGHDICGDTTYIGFYCSALPGQGQNLRVTSAVFDGFGLCAPKLEGFIDRLPDLALFQATSNKFGAFGNVNKLASLTYLYKLSSGPGSGDDLAHPLNAGPPIIDIKKICIKARYMLKICAGLKVHLSDVSLVAVPGSVKSRALLLNNNDLSGLLPVDLGLSKLSYLALANNKLTGPIPSSIEHLQDSLFEVLLLNNQLSGCLPHEFGMLHKATVIDAGANQLTGPIPRSFSCLTSVEQLNLAGNRLYGEVPDALCKLAGPAGRLANLTLSGNYFNSVGPACAALIRDGVLDVKNNCIPGLANQRRPAECAAFQSQPKTCPAATTTAQVACPAAAAATNAEAAETAEKAARREYSSYVTYATLHD